MSAPSDEAVSAGYTELIACNGNFGDMFWPVDEAAEDGGGSVGVENGSAGPDNTESQVEGGQHGGQTEGSYSNGKQ
ncbi:ScfA [Metarhizium robertsii ARSEF 23]|uniref:ScfA n=1 Tax=Metarhizium robertsii (strain ARSEF 23 / ATCC MYA-3075) TaxID=655844 RepID=A0A0B2XIL1_METRA|nr:ScfA [Metarhizium robertsii ARSEF 23]KHO11671.1 ScfA [Metarhizium robertsii ARSEF 23]